MIKILDEEATWSALTYDISQIYDNMEKKSQTIAFYFEEVSIRENS